MATITLNPTGQSTLAHAVSGGSNYAVLADNSDSSYIYAKATESEVTTTSIFQMGNSNSIAGRFVVTGISTMIRNKNGASGMNTSSMAANLYVGGIEGRSWGNSLGTSWTDRTHTSGVNEFSVLDGKLLTSLPQILLHIASVLKVNKTGDDKWNGASKASVTLTYDNYYVQSAQGSTGVIGSVANPTAFNGYYKSGSITEYIAFLENGYGFRGWFDNPDGTGTPVSTTLSYRETCGSDRVLYAFTYKLTLVGDSNITLSATLINDGTGRKFSIDGQYRNTGSPLSKCYCSSFSVNSLQYEPQNFLFPLQVEITEDTVIAATSSILTLEGDAGISSLSLGKETEGMGTFDCTMPPGYYFTGWYLGEEFITGTQSSFLLLYHWPSESLILTARTSLCSYFLNSVADTHCTTSVSSPDTYYGTTATFAAVVTDNQYTFAGWYEDPSFTTLYSTALVTSYVITGDKTLYAKTIPLNKFFLKVENTWKTVSKVFRKINNVWVEVSIEDYTDLFDVNQKYIKGD